MRESFTFAFKADRSSQSNQDVHVGIITAKSASSPCFFLGLWEDRRNKNSVRVKPRSRGNLAPCLHHYHSISSQTTGNSVFTRLIVWAAKYTLLLLSSLCKPWDSVQRLPPPPLYLSTEVSWMSQDASQLLVQHSQPRLLQKSLFQFLWAGGRAMVFKSKTDFFWVPLSILKCLFPRDAFPPHI